jgi:hypothetical protein
VLPFHPRRSPQEKGGGFAAAGVERGLAPSPDATERAYVSVRGVALEPCKRSRSFAIARASISRTLSGVRPK